MSIAKKPLKTDRDRILVLAPHIDDGEFGCGGTISKHVQDGAEIFYVAFSQCENAMSPSLPKGTLVDELYEATRILGVPRDQVVVFDYPNRNFLTMRQDILQDMIHLKNQIKPTKVFLPSEDDTHQDHQVIAQEGFRAFKTTSIFAYEMPWNNLTFRTSAFFVLSQQDVERKIQAMRSYRSQEHRSYASSEFIRSLAVVRGTQIGVDYAETFDIVRLIKT